MTDADKTLDERYAVTYFQDAPDLPREVVMSTKAWSEIKKTLRFERSQSSQDKAMIEDLVYRLENEREDKKVLMEASKSLWYLLDDISAYGDMYKPGISAYFKAVDKKCEERSKYFNSDGYELSPSAALEKVK